MCVGTDCFCHLHVHTDASRIDGLGPVSRLINAASRRGFKQLAMTDHGSLANTISFISECKQAGIKPIIGMEGYINVDGTVGHITLLADGNSGFTSLVALNNLGQRSSYRKPAFTLDDLVRHNRDLLCLSGCPASPLQADDWNAARSVGLRLKSAFGSRLFSEVMFVGDAPTWERSHKLSKDLGIPLVTTNDVHFAYSEDAESHKVLVNLKAAFSYDSRFLYLASPTEILKRITDRGHTEALPLARAGFINAGKIAQRIRPVVFSGEPTLPHIANADGTLRELSEATLESKFGRLHPSYDELSTRMNYELSVIGDMDFSAYFLILHDMVSYARLNGVRVGPGRGSGAGSLVLFLLGVTEINPLDYDLSFERFLNPKRKGMPDVDVDFDSEGRHKVIEYATKRWNALPVANYSRYSHKMLVHDLCRYFRMPRDLEKEAADRGPESPEFIKLCSSEPLMKRTYDAMMGQIRHIGQHAGGIIITDAPAPIERASGEERFVTAWTEGESRELGQAGIVKFDILGISALSVLKALESKMGFHANLPTDDAQEFEVFRKGDLSGIFQFAGSDGIRQLTIKVAPRCFEDLVAINALYRPGALDAGTADMFPEWRKKPRKIHPLVDPILKSTSGVIVYQEQVMAIYAVMTDGDLASADVARKTISKSRIGDPQWEVEMSQLQVNFLNGCVSKEVDEKIAEQLWRELSTHARYSFNRSHSVAYAMVSWEMAWWKFNHPVEFYAAMLTVDQGNTQEYIFDILQGGIKIVPPHVNHSTDKYEAVDDQIYMPLGAIKFVAGNGVKAIMDAKPFTSMTDFMARVAKRAVTSRARLGLYELGAFTDVAGTRKELAIKDAPDMSDVEKQQTYMGFILLTDELMAEIEATKSSGGVAGIIANIKEKESAYGQYFVYYLVPNGIGWSRQRLSYKIGDSVKFRLKVDSGKILSSSLI